MKWIMNGLSSYFRQGSGTAGLTAANSGDNEIVFGCINTAGGKTNESRSADGLDRKLAGIMYADIADYSRLTDEDEEGTHHRLVEGIWIIKTCVAASDGKVAHVAGDAVLAEFGDADSALRCAVNIQLAARQWNANIPPDRHIQFRIGVNFGEVIEDQGDIYGKAVNLAARLESLAHSGGICISRTARSQLREKSSIKYISLGKRQVKNIKEPVEAFWIEIESEQIVDSELTAAVTISAVAS